MSGYFVPSAGLSFSRRPDEKDVGSFSEEGEPQLSPGVAGPGHEEVVSIPPRFRAGFSPSKGFDSSLSRKERISRT